MEWIQAGKQLLSTGLMAAAVTFVIIYMMNKRPYHWPKTWFYVALAVVLVLIAVVPNGWNVFFTPSEAAVSFDTVSYAAGPEKPNYSLLFKADFWGTIAGLVIGWIASTFVPTDR